VNAYVGLDAGAKLSTICGGGNLATLFGMRNRLSPVLRIGIGMREAEEREL